VVLVGSCDPTSCCGSHSARCSAVLEPLRTPNGIRTRVTALKGRRPRPLDDGGPCVTRVKHRGDLQQHQSDCPRTPSSPLLCERAGPYEPRCSTLGSLCCGLCVRLTHRTFGVFLDMSFHLRRCETDPPEIDVVTGLQTPGLTVEVQNGRLVRDRSIGTMTEPTDPGPTGRTLNEEPGTRLGEFGRSHVLVPGQYQRHHTVEGLRLGASVQEGDVDVPRPVGHLSGFFLTLCRHFFGRGVDPGRVGKVPRIPGAVDGQPLDLLRVTV